MAVRPSAILLIARREYLVRARTRSFRVATVILVLAAVALVMAPVAVRWFDRGSTSKVDVVMPADLGFDASTVLGSALNVSVGAGDTPDFTFISAADAATAREAVASGNVSAAIIGQRVSSGDLTFTIVTKDSPALRTPMQLQQGVGVLATTDRLIRGGFKPEQIAALGVPPEVSVVPPNETTGKPAQDVASEVGGLIVGQALVIFLFMAIILYGQWVAMSVAEEKSSRVMELVLNAATPAELLAGKVVGVGGLGLTQYAAAAVPAGIALMFQDQIASLFLGSSSASTAAASPAATLTPGLLVTFGVLFVLGFLLYAVLYAAAGSLVSRMEDINSVVAPMTLVGAAGYFVAVYTATGLIPADASWVVILSYVPFVSPYLMLSRVAAGTAAPIDVVVASALLVVTIAAALWVAARVYAAGVLTYGQKVGPRAFVAAALRPRR